MNSEMELERVLQERDDAHEVADNLAHALAAITGVDIGEHSSENDPWQNALDAAEDHLTDVQARAELVSARTELDRLRADIGRAYAIGRRDCRDELLAIQAQYGGAAS